jgi:hypothetical protein
MRNYTVTDIAKVKFEIWSIESETKRPIFGEYRKFLKCKTFPLQKNTEFNIYRTSEAQIIIFPKNADYEIREENTFLKSFKTTDEERHFNLICNFNEEESVDENSLDVESDGIYEAIFDKKNQIITISNINYNHPIIKTNKSNNIDLHSLWNKKTFLVGNDEVKKPTKKFWDIWRDRKEELKKIYSIKKVHVNYFVRKIENI